MIFQQSLADTLQIKTTDSIFLGTHFNYFLILILGMHFYSSKGKSTYSHQPVAVYKNKKTYGTLSNKTNKACFASDLFPISLWLKPI